MGHEIEETDGMVYAGAAPWHIAETADRSKELPLDAQSSPLRALELARAAYDVLPAKLFARIPHPDGGFEDVPLDTHRAQYRGDNGGVLGVVGAAYETVQNRAVAEWMAPFCDAGATIETLGTLQGGRRFWCLARMPGAAASVTAAAGDQLNAFLLFSHGHDGTLSVRIGQTWVRVVCANTLRAAHSAETSRLVRFKHTKGVGTAMVQAQRIIDRETGEFKATIEQYQYLASRHIADPADLKAYVRIVAGIEPLAELADDKLSPRTRNKLARIEELVWRGAGNTAPEVRGTWYAALNGVADYVTHEAGRGEDTRVASMFWGDGSTMLAKATAEAQRFATLER